MAPTLREGLKTWNIPADASSGRKWPETAGAISLSSPFQGAGVRVELSGCLGRFLVSQLSEPDCLVLVAEDAGQVVGYVFAQLMPISWKDLRGPCGFVHDVYVLERARRQGVGKALLRAAIDWIRSNGRSQIVLWSKSGNESAQRLFAQLGFRDTMVEMTLDTEPSKPSE